jgi:23S rRNA (cytidine1920-2'-O)/16S rRNA (cytidine1409-2'-O)-methyltransferase
MGSTSATGEVRLLRFAPTGDNARVVRLDVLLAERGLVESRSRAQALVLAGRVRVDDQVVTKAGSNIGPEARLEVDLGPPFVSRGGAKLAAALDAFSVDPTGLACLDVGASTGGFTDCLLQRGASAVCAVDVGRGQLHERLRQDPRVTVVDGVNARALEPSLVPFRAALGVIDVSFISLALVLPPTVACLGSPWRCLPLVKPQFEAGRGQAPGGVVRDPAVRRAALERIVSVVAELGAVTLDACSSGLPGPAGNREFFLHVVSSDHPDAATPPRDLDALLDRAVDAAV